MNIPRLFLFSLFSIMTALPSWGDSDAALRESLRASGTELIARWRELSGFQGEIEWVVNHRPEFPQTRWVTYPSVSRCRIVVSVSGRKLSGIQDVLPADEAWRVNLLHELAHCGQISRIDWSSGSSLRAPIMGWSSQEVDIVWRAMMKLHKMEATTKKGPWNELRPMVAFLETEADLQSMVWAQTLYPAHYQDWLVALASWRSSRAAMDAWHDSSHALWRLHAYKMGSLQSFALGSVLRNPDMRLRSMLANAVGLVRQEEEEILRSWEVLKLSADRSVYPKACPNTPDAYFDCVKSVEKLKERYLRPYDSLRARLMTQALASSK